MSTLKEWLGKQGDREDMVGELARDALSKSESSKWKTPKQLMARVADTAAREAVIQSFREFADATKERADVLRLLAAEDAEE